METWLITPIISNISTKSLRINTSKAYRNHTFYQPFTVMILEGFNSYNSEEATWIEINNPISINNYQ